MLAALCLSMMIAFPKMQYIEAYHGPVECVEAYREPTTLLSIVDFDGVSERQQELYKTYACVEPEAIQQELVNYGAQIHVAPSSKYTHEGSAGTYWTGSGYIGINCKTDNKMKIAVNHEIGHCVDEILSYYYNIDWQTDQYIGAYCKFLSESPEFQQIFREECSTAGYPKYNSTCPPEYFAETYRYVVEGNKKMMEKAPRATEFVKTALYEVYQIEF